MCLCIFFARHSHLILNLVVQLVRPKAQAETKSETEPEDATADVAPAEVGRRGGEAVRKADAGGSGGLGQPRKEGKPESEGAPHCRGHSAGATVQGPLCRGHSAGALECVPTLLVSLHSCTTSDTGFSYADSSMARICLDMPQSQPACVCFLLCLAPALAAVPKATASLSALGSVVSALAEPSEAPQEKEAAAEDPTLPLPPPPPLLLLLLLPLLLTAQRLLTPPLCLHLEEPSRVLPEALQGKVKGNFGARAGAVWREQAHPYPQGQWRVTALQKWGRL